MPSKALPAVLVLALVPCVASAAPDDESYPGPKTSIYAGAGITRSSIDEELAPGIRLDAHSTGWNAFVGYTFSEYVAAEIGYTRIPEASTNVQGVEVGLKGYGISASVLPTLPLGERLQLYGRVGALQWNADALVSVPGFSASVKEDGTDVIYGAGVALYVERGARLRLEYARAKLDDVDVDQVSLSLSWSF